MEAYSNMYLLLNCEFRKHLLDEVNPGVTFKNAEWWNLFKRD
jgi:hypothetical protein